MREKITTAIIVAFCVIGLVSGSANAASVPAGTDYLATQPGTFFDFGPGVGIVNFTGDPINPALYGNTDTIVQRLSDVTINSPSGGPIQVGALSLVSTAPVAGFGNQLIYITLTPSDLALDIGNITIEGNPSGGTFSSFFDVWFDVHLGSLNGNVIYQSNDSFTTTGASWSSTAVPNAIGNSDFWPIGVVDHNAGNGAHLVAVATTPLPATWTIMLIGLAGLGFVGYRQSGKAALPVAA